MKSTLARIHNILAWLLFAGSITQFFLISLTFFGVTSSEVHANSGRILMLVALLMTIIALIIRANRWNVLFSILALLLLMPVQGALAYAEGFPGVIRALHALVGMLILGLGYSMANGFARAVVPSEQKVSQSAAAAD